MNETIEDIPEPDDEFRPAIVRIANGDGTWVDVPVLLNSKGWLMFDKSVGDKTKEDS